MPYDACRRRAAALAGPAVILVVAAVALGAAGPAYGGAAPAPADGEATVAFRIRDDRIAESSGLAASAVHRGVVWTINDSGDAARLFALDRRGRTAAVVDLAGLEPRDWEAVTSGVDDEGRPALFVGDIGDNSESRDHGILVHVVTEPDELADATVEATSYRLRYPDGPHDAEALLVHPETNRLFVVTKELFGGGIYAAPEELDASAPNELERVASAPSLVTGGSYLPDGRYVLRDYSAAWLYAADRTELRRIELPWQEQGESLTVTPDGSALLVGSEGAASEVWRVPVGGEPDADGAGSSAEPSAPSPPSPGDAADEGSEPADSEGGWLEANAAMMPVVLAGVVLLSLLGVAAGWLVGRRVRRR
jgi:hypothetical protein